MWGDSGFMSVPQGRSDPGCQWPVDRHSGGGTNIPKKTQQERGSHESEYKNDFVNITRAKWL